MRKLLFAFALLISGATGAQEVIRLVKQLKCSDAQFVMNEFTQNYGESPVWVGKTDHNTHVTLLVNKDKKTWTMLEYDAKIACVLAVGEGGSNPDFGT
jgi:hypothetical protein